MCAVELTRYGSINNNLRLEDFTDYIDNPNLADPDILKQLQRAKEERNNERILLFVTITVAIMLLFLLTVALDKTYQKFVKYLNELKIRAEKKKEAQENLKLTQASEISIRDEETRRLQLKFINTQIQHPGSSTADELLKLKTLIDSGALTLEEYNESPQSKPNVARCNV